MLLFNQVQQMIREWVQTAGLGAAAAAEARAAVVVDLTNEDPVDRGCAACGEHGAVALCDTCQRPFHVHAPCTSYAFPPGAGEAFACNDCRPRAPAPVPDAEAGADGEAMFGCSICFDEWPEERRVVVDGCQEHDNAPVCSACMFRHFRRAHTCPICRHASSTLRQQTTGLAFAFPPIAEDGGPEGEEAD